MIPKRKLKKEKKGAGRLVRTLFLGITLCLMFFSPALAYEKIVVLYPAVSPILIELGALDMIVGTTRSDHAVKGVVKVGSHLRPNIELLNALAPDLIIAGSRRAFPYEMKERVKADIFYYDPATLDDILVKIKKIGAMLERKDKAENLVARLKKRLSEISSLPRQPSVIYEVMAEPLRVAGKKSILTSIISAAGGNNLVSINKKHAVISTEKVLKLTPDFYVYQVGPMNKNPVPPEERPFYKSLKSKFIRINELEFARPGINAFDAAVKLNIIFKGAAHE
ncbi:MAG TPA: iron ABC transporter substrate-binding protein [Nitrospirae bacterium]|nr:vitamin B12-binding protein precursor [bacterium BMS3Bbin09]HDN95343.1 iron ABC transporter substrate-binding protein [Nitrospirota bacterium]HDO66710.1 iron ABC transporter substrate-binding protein [Nitrospirota bacterium]HDY71107.1 iron ABC transporter substrate-binding protein [Nitrospirota bacterium]HEW80884.1 iron ABC transporter substrate-binding protein [Nitrospirota bacterium]